MADYRIIKRLGLLVALSVVAVGLLASPDTGVAGPPVQSAPGTTWRCRPPK